MLLDKGAQLLPALPANWIPDTRLLIQFAYTQFSLQALFFFFSTEWLKACLQRGFLSERVSRLSQLVWICHMQQPQIGMCPGCAMSQNPLTGKGVHPPRGCSLPLLSRLWVWSEEWWCGWRKAVSFITISKSCYSRSPCLCQRLPAPFLSHFRSFAQPRENGHNMICKLYKAARYLPESDISTQIWPAAMCWLTDFFFFFFLLLLNELRVNYSLVFIH